MNLATCRFPQFSTLTVVSIFCLLLQFVNVAAAAVACADNERGNVTVNVGRPSSPVPFELSWQHNCTEESTTFRLQADATGWVAVGLCDKAPGTDVDLMVGCEFFLFNAEGNARNGAVAVENGEPKALAVSMIRNESLSVAYVGTRYNVSFSRAWRAVDVNHSSLDAPDGLRVMAASGPTSFFGVQHFGSDRAQHPSKIYFFGAPPATASTSSAAVDASTTSGAASSTASVVQSKAQSSASKQCQSMTMTMSCLLAWAILSRLLN
jgi:hypothetical protein